MIRECVWLNDPETGETCRTCLPRLSHGGVESEVDDDVDVDLDTHVDLGVYYVDLDVDVDVGECYLSVSG